MCLAMLRIVNYTCNKPLNDNSSNVNYGMYLFVISPYPSQAQKIRRVRVLKEVTARKRKDRIKLVDYSSTIQYVERSW